MLLVNKYNKEKDMTYSTALENENDITQASSSISITIERANLLKALGHVQSVVERRNTIPILSNVKLEAANNSLSLTATDMDIAITEKISADVDQEGALTVPAHTLYDIVRKLPDGSQIELSGNSQDGGKLNITSGHCEFSLSCLPVEDFPVMDKGDVSHDFTLAPAELAAIIDKTKFAISNEETRYYLNGIFLHSKDDGENSNLVAVATDGHRLAKIELTLPDGAAGMPGIIIPRKTVNELRKLIENAEEEVQVFVSDTKICFVCDDAILVSKLIDGTFPDYDKVIPVGNNRLLQLKTADLSKAVDRVSTISSEKTRAIKLNLSSGKVQLSATNEENGTAAEELEASYSSENIEIGFNSRYLLEMITSIEGEEVQIFFASGGAPALVKDPSYQGSLFVIMPMRI